MKILIADDDFSSRLLIKRYLKTVGECDTVVNGKEVLEAFTLAHAEQSPYDLILLDVLMPEMDGYTALKELRKREEKMGIFGSKTVKVIVTTVFDDFGHVKKAFNHQCESYIVKPVNQIDLLQKVNSVIN